MERIKISAVSYTNSLPFIHGLKNSGFLNGNIELQLDMPSRCAEKLLSNQVDIGLIPVAVIPLLAEHHILSDYCIGAVGKVASVLLVSEEPLENIGQVLLDYQSRTSIQLVKVLAKLFWKINPKWIFAGKGYETHIKESTAGVIIGDRTFGMKPYTYVYDLAEEWQKFTGLPFVFAAWVANKQIDNQFVTQFSQALEFGIQNIPEVIADFRKNHQINGFDIEHYFKHNISYDFDAPKKKLLHCF